jgi:hypothetical protein
MTYKDPPITIKAENVFITSPDGSKKGTPVSSPTGGKLVRNVHNKMVVGGRINIEIANKRLKQKSLSR